MTQSIEDRIHRMLENKGVEKAGFPIKSVDFLMEWDGYDVYEYHLHFDEPLCIGTPWFYLVKDNKIAETNIDQTLEIMAKADEEVY